MLIIKLRKKKGVPYDVPGAIYRLMLLSTEAKNNKSRPLLMLFFPVSVWGSRLIGLKD